MVKLPHAAAARPVMLMCSMLTLLLAGAIAPAQAARSDSPHQITPAAYKQFVRALSAIEDHPKKSSGTKSVPKLSAGGGFTNPYISFNQTDQRALLNGGVAAIVGTICVVGSPIACAVAGVITAVALVYLNKYGICPKSKKNLRVYVYSRTAKCHK